MKDIWLFLFFSTRVHGTITSILVLCISLCIHFSGMFSNGNSCSKGMGMIISVHPSCELSLPPSILLWLRGLDRTDKSTNSLAFCFLQHLANEDDQQEMEEGGKWGRVIYFPSSLQVGCSRLAPIHH